MPICREFTGATGLEPATSGVTDQFEGRELDGVCGIPLFTRISRRGAGRFAATCAEGAVRRADVGQLPKRVQRTEADRTFGLIEGHRIVPLPGADDGTEAEREGRRVRESEGSVEGCDRGLVV